MHDEHAFHQLVSRAEYPMFVVTATSGVERSGCLVGFVTQASIDPPRLLVLLSKANHTYRVAQGAGALAVHFLSRRNLDLARLFGEETGDATDKLGGCEWIPSPEGLPLLPGTRGWVVGSIVERVDCGDHVAHLLDVRAATVDVEAEQLGFQAVRDLPPGHPPEEGKGRPAR